MATTFIFAGGGTGGHLFPGLAIARRLTDLAAPGEARLLFICSDRSIDRSILEPESVPFLALPARPIGLHPRTLARFLSTWGECVRRSRRAIADATASGPVRVIAMGGFAAAPVVQAARRSGTAVTLVNLDAAPGKANRWIARHADAAFTTVASPDHPHWRLVPPIVRASAAAAMPQAQCRAQLGLDAARSTLMVTGGSQGAGSINDLLRLLVDAAAPLRDGRWQVLHQCGGARSASGDAGAMSDGASLAAELSAAYRAAGIPARVEPFTRQMGLWWGSADLAISRAGAGAVAEAWCNRVPTVFLPYPYHRDQHQRLNAEVLVAAGGTITLTDHITRAGNTPHVPVIAGLLADAARRAAMREALAKLGPADGADRVARALLANV